MFISPKNPLILASQSPYRKILLKKLGIPFSTQRPACNEEELKKELPDLGPRGLCMSLGFEKAKSIKKLFPEAFVIGSDQILLFENQIFDKPNNFETAFKQLKLMQGKKHTLETSLFLLVPDQPDKSNSSHQYINVTTLQMIPLTDLQIEAYLKLDEPYDCAGSYKFEKNGARLFANIETSDPFAIEGLPLLMLNLWLQEYLV